ncbi:chalcone-flavanone isomerase-domain-containing protein [Russula brevipes]|nr:chalcone-flavanone isomerase-domain-containing protein [Russula brevipes]
MLRRILVSTFPRGSRPRPLYSPNAPRLSPLTLGAAVLAFSTGVGVLHLDSDTFRDKEATVVDPATSIEFPTTLQIPSKGALPEFTLIGVGVRLLSFLGIKVYSAAFYADLTNPDLKIPWSASPEERLEYIIRNTACVLRIIPTRNTNYTHLRDAFVRTLQKRRWADHQAEIVIGRAAQASGAYRPTEVCVPERAAREGYSVGYRALPSGLEWPRTLIIRDLGAVQNEWVAQEFMLSFFDWQGNSPALKQSVFEGVAQL